MVFYTVWRTRLPPTIAQYAVRISRPLRPIFLVLFPEGRRVSLRLIELNIHLFVIPKHSYDVMLQNGLKALPPSTESVL